MYISSSRATKKFSFLLFTTFVLSFFPAQKGFCEGKDSVTVYLRSILLDGNSVTRPRIILRELTFDKGTQFTRATLDSAIGQSKTNLLNTNIFYNAYFDEVIIDKDTIDILIRVKEAIYTWPIPIFEIPDRNFNVWWRRQDFSRVVYGLYLTRYNFRGRRETIDLALRTGYTQQLGLSYNIPFINKKQNIGLGFSVSYLRTHELAYGSVNNQLVFYRDLNNYVREQYGAAVGISYRPKFFTFHSFNIGYTQTLIDKKIALDYNTDYFLNRSSQQSYFYANYNYTYDRRDMKMYPLSGHYLYASLQKRGIFNKDIDQSTIAGGYKYYYPVNSRLYAAASIDAQYTAGKQSFSTMRSINFSDNTIRGYEYYLLYGNYFWLVKNNLKLKLFNTRSLNYKILSNTKFSSLRYCFFLNLGVDAGYAGDNSVNAHLNRLNNSFQYGASAGLDFVLYYTFVFRVDYSINKLGEKGFYLHFSSPI